VVMFVHEPPTNFQVSPSVPVNGKTVGGGETPPNRTPYPSAPSYAMDEKTRGEGLTVEVMLVQAPPRNFHVSPKGCRMGLQQPPKSTTYPSAESYIVEAPLLKLPGLALVGITVQVPPWNSQVSPASIKT
jgi:hypothetical protein